MSDIAAEVHSATSSEDAEDASTAAETRICEAFSSLAGNVAFKSSDNVVFRIEDFYLKANRSVSR